MPYDPEAAHTPTVGPLSELHLEARKAQASQHIPRHMLRETLDDSGMPQEFFRNHLLHRLEATVFAENCGAVEHVIEEEPVYRSHRHAYLDGLPERSLRRRFLHWRWRIDPSEHLGQKRTHVVRVERWLNFPEAQIYPESLGRPYRATYVTPRATVDRYPAGRDREIAP